jgi:transposase
MLSSGYVLAAKADRAMESSNPLASMVKGCFDSFIGDVTSTIPFRRLSKVINPLQNVSHYLTEGCSMTKKLTVEQAKEIRRSGKSTIFELINQDAAGIDIGSEEHWVAVPEGRDEHSVRKFGCFTADLHEMANWLKQCGVKTVAMESTGVFWIPPFQILQRHGIEVKLVNARQARNVPGRKTDVSDCQWLQRLHTYGLLSGSFRPEDQVCVLRSYWRHRDNLVKYASAHIQHMQKAMTEMNIQIHKVLSDITGVTGMRIIRAILSGERDGERLADMREPGVKRSKEDIIKALQGDYREEHLFALQQAVELYDSYHEKIRQCDERIHRCLKGFDGQAGTLERTLKKVSHRSRKNECHIDLRAELYRITGVDFTEIDGLDVLSINTILSEVGLKPDAFPTVKSFTSWLGLCPNNRITGGKIKSSSTKRVFNRAATTFRIAAQSLANSKCALGGFYRRLRARLGAPKAITATAHKLARIFYVLWSTKKRYQDIGAEYYERQYKERVVRNLKRKAHELGYIITPLQVGVS